MRARSVRPALSGRFALLGALAALFVAELALPACSASEKTQPPAELGRFRLRTFPKGARVTHAKTGKELAHKTPATLVLPPGDYPIRVQAPGADAIEREITVVGGEARSLTLRIPPSPEARVSVLSDVEGASVRINGYGRGQTPLLGVTTKPGPLDVTVTAPDGRALAQKGMLHVGEHRSLTLFFGDFGCRAPAKTDRAERFQTLRAPRGWLTLGLKPDGVIYRRAPPGSPSIVGERLGSSPLENLMLPAGKHRLLLRDHKGDYEREVEVSVPANRSVVYRFRLQAGDERE